MNVNLWGPALWEVLHGCAYLINENNFKAFNIMMYELNILLPCIHCLRSYRDFYVPLPTQYQGSNIYYMKYVYDLHNMVNNKLDKQKNRPSSNPSFEVIKKRAALSEGHPFSKASAWKAIFAIALACTNVKSFSSFIENFAAIVTQKYYGMSQALHKLYIHLACTRINDTKELFLICAMARNGNNVELAMESYSVYIQNMPAGSCGSLTCA